MPADLSEFEALSTVNRGTCTAATAIAKIPDAERANLDAALAASHISHAAISRWFSDRDVKIAEGTIGRHRLKKCSCPA